MADISELFGVERRKGWDKPLSPAETRMIEIREKYRGKFNAGVGQGVPSGMVYVRHFDADNQESRYILVNENWETVVDLMEKSLEQNIDLLWERYKNNIIPDDVVI
jgi:hypothetical protein